MISFISGIGGLTFLAGIAFVIFGFEIDNIQWLLAGGGAMISGAVLFVFGYMAYLLSNTERQLRAMAEMQRKMLIIMEREVGIRGE
ncbi:MAG: hypothetical protein ABJO09_00920 [Hyphomicrobiales bacterium]